MNVAYIYELWTIQIVHLEPWQKFCLDSRRNKMFNFEGLNYLYYCFNFCFKRFYLKYMDLFTGKFQHNNICLYCNDYFLTLYTFVCSNEINLNKNYISLVGFRWLLIYRNNDIDASEFTVYTNRDIRTLVSNLYKNNIYIMLMFIHIRFRKFWILSLGAKCLFEIDDTWKNLISYDTNKKKGYTNLHFTYGIIKPNQFHIVLW